MDNFVKWLVFSLPVLLYDHKTWRLGNLWEFYKMSIPWWIANDRYFPFSFDICNYWNYYPSAVSLSQVTAAALTIGNPWVIYIYVCMCMFVRVCVCACVRVFACVRADTAVGGKKVTLRKQFAHNWHITYCQCAETHVFFAQNYTYTPLPGVSSPEVTIPSWIAMVGCVLFCSTDANLFLTGGS